MVVRHQIYLRNLKVQCSICPPHSMKSKAGPYANSQGESHAFARLFFFFAYLPDYLSSDIWWHLMYYYLIELLSKSHLSYTVGDSYLMKGYKTILKLKFLCTILLKFNQDILLTCTRQQSISLSPAEEMRQLWNRNTNVSMSTFVQKHQKMTQTGH